MVPLYWEFTGWECTANVLELCWDECTAKLSRHAMQGRAALARGAGSRAWVLDWAGVDWG